MWHYFRTPDSVYIDMIADEIAEEFVESMFGEKHKKKKYISSLPEIVKVIYNEPATIVFWADGTKTISICDGEEEYNKLTGFSICIAKKFMGNTEFRAMMEKFVYDIEQ